MSFFKLKETDFLTAVVTAYPSYSYRLTDYSSAPIFLQLSSSEGRARYYSGIDGLPVTGAFNLSGTVTFLTSSALSSREKRSINRMRQTYAANSLVKFENYTSSSIFNPALPASSQTFHVVNIPSILYGGEIKPGSFSFEIGSNKFNDDLYGGIYTGSLHVGCIFYEHGIAVLGSKINAAASLAITASFSGTNKIPTNMYLCKVQRGLLNFSNNPSYTTYVSQSNREEIGTKQPKTFITSIGLYDEDYKLIAVAKISNPVLNEEDTALLFKLKLAF